MAKILVDFYLVIVNFSLRDYDYVYQYTSLLPTKIFRLSTFLSKN